MYHHKYYRGHFFAGKFFFLGFAFLALFMILALTMGAFSLIFGTGAAGGLSGLGLIELAVLCLACPLGLGLIFGLFALFRFAFWRAPWRGGGWRPYWGAGPHRRGGWGGQPPAEEAGQDEPYPPDYL